MGLAVCRLCRLAAPSKYCMTRTKQHSLQEDRRQFDNREYSTEVVFLPSFAPSTLRLSQQLLSS